MQNTSRIWDRWLLLVTIGLFLFSAAFIVLPDVMVSFYNLLLYGTQDAGFAPDALRHIKFAYGVLGGVMIGWAVMILYLLMTSFARREREGWNTLTASVLVWFVVDSGFSVVAGFAPNAVFNTAFLVLFLIPLAMTYREFYTQPQSIRAS